MPHTPGPWTVAVERNRPQAYNDVEAPQQDWPNRKIALVPCDNENYSGNGHVIAAAPDLLAVCRMLLRFCSNRDGSLARYEDWLETFVEDGSTITAVVVTAQAAVAKAEGR